MNCVNSVVLAGRRPESHENLSIAYLTSALGNAGVDVSVVSVNSLNEVSDAADRLLAMKPVLVGLSITDSSSALLMLTLGEMLSRRGYPGHITCGGGFATLQRSWLLNNNRWLSSVVRLDGEETLPRLFTALKNGKSAATVPGVSTRMGDGAPAPVGSELPMTLWPARDRFPKMLNHRAASMLMSRGCVGNCEYCGPAALQQLERDEAQLQSIAYPCGNGRVRRRTVNDLASEMAYLYHQNDVRYFAFTDEHLLPTGVNAGRQFLQELMLQLREKKVAHYGFGGQLGGHQISVELCRELAAAGMVRAHVGLDLTGDGKVFSRPNLTNTQVEAIHHLNQSGISTISTILLLHPYATLDSIAHTLNDASQLKSGFVEFGQMLAYGGTVLAERLALEGRLVGNPLRYHYTFDDPRLSRFEQFFAALRSHAFGGYSIMQRAHELASQMRLASRLGYSSSVRDSADVNRIRKAAFELSLQAYQEALAICTAELSGNETVFAEIYRRGQLVLRRKLEEVENRFYEQKQLAPKSVSLFSSGAASILTLVSVLGAAGCNSENETGSDTDEIVDSATASDTDSYSDSGGLVDSDTASGVIVDSQSESSDEARLPVSLPECEPANSTQEDTARKRIQDAVKSIDACLCSNFDNTKEGGLDWLCEPYSVSASLQPRDANRRVLLNTAVASAIETSGATCIPTRLRFEGESLSDWIDLFSAANEECKVFVDSYNVIPYAAVDENGVARIAEAMLENNIVTQENFDCANQVLSKLTFPCLAGMDISAAYLIIE